MSLQNRRRNSLIFFIKITKNSNKKADKIQERRKIECNCNFTNDYVFRSIKKRGNKKRVTEEKSVILRKSIEKIVQTIFFLSKKR